MIVEGVAAWMWVAAAGAFVLGGMVKGLSGFGLPLIVISLTSTFMPIEVALAINVIPPFLLNFWQAGGLRGARDTWHDYAPALIGLVIGIFVGAASAAAVDANWLVGAVGVVTLAYCVSQFLGWRPHLSPAQIAPAGLVVGLLSGFLGALTTVAGPPLVMYLMAARATPAGFKAALGLFFFAAGIMLTLAFASIGFLSLPLAVAGGLMAVPAAAGMWLGRHLARRIDADRFRTIVLVLLTVLGVNLVRRAIYG